MGNDGYHLNVAMVTGTAGVEAVVGLIWSLLEVKETKRNSSVHKLVIPSSLAGLALKLIHSAILGFHVTSRHHKIPLNRR